MQIKTGVDIIEVDRVQEAIENQEEKFLEKVYTKMKLSIAVTVEKWHISIMLLGLQQKEAIFKAISEFIPKNEDDILNK